MDVSAEAADLVVKEGIQATESAVKLAGAGLKNVAALLLALQRQDNKVIGKTTAKRLARDPAPAEVMIALGYPIPQQAREGEPPKKAKAPAPQERSSPERGSGLNPSPMTGPDIEMKESVRARLEGLRAMAESRSREKTRDKTR